MQKSVALSSCEAEYMALKEALKESKFLSDLYENLEIKTGSKTMYTDSNSAIELAKNPEHHSRTKHIDIQYHYVRECVQNGLARLEFVPTKEQIADILTKALDTTSFNRLADLLVSDF